MMIPILPLLAPSKASSAPERLFVYFRERGRRWDPTEGVYEAKVPKTDEEAYRPSGGELCALWLPSGRRAVLPRQAGGPRFFGDPRALLVSPTGGYVAIVVRQTYDPHLLVQDVARGVRRDVEDLTSDLSRLPAFRVGLDWIGPDRLLVTDSGLSTLERRADGWYGSRDWPSGAAFRRQAERLRRIGNVLDQRDLGRYHEALGFSADERLLAAYSGQQGGPVTDPGPVPTGQARLTLYAYDGRTLRRVIGGPTWDEPAGAPPAIYRYAGWVGERLAYVGPSRKDPRVPALALRDAKGAREYPLDGLVGRLWSLQGGPGVPSRPY